MTVFAGLYGAATISNPDGVPLPNLPVAVYELGTTTLATLYADNTATGTVANPTTTDALGNLSFYAEPGRYTISSNAGMEVVAVVPDPEDYLGVTQGPQGFQGFQGNQGNQGMQGVQGAQGTQGPQGNQGNQGVTGAGTQGAQGNQGFQGPSGGAQGAQGTQGTQGSQGNQGTQGPQGFQGTTGSQGPQGAQGVATLTTAGGTLGSPFTVTTSLTAFLTTTSLAVGTWWLTLDGVVTASLISAAECDIEIGLGTATATFNGPTSTSVGINTSVNQTPVQPFSFTTRVVVTVAGTIVYKAQGFNYTIVSATPNQSFAGATGYNGLKVA